MDFDGITIRMSYSTDGEIPNYSCRKMVETFQMKIAWHFLSKMYYRDDCRNSHSSPSTALLYFVPRLQNHRFAFLHQVSHNSNPFSTILLRVIPKRTSCPDKTKCHRNFSANSLQMESQAATATKNPLSSAHIPKAFSAATIRSLKRKFLATPWAYFDEPDPTSNYFQVDNLAQVQIKWPDTKIR